jgi:hypothetical protein
MSRRSAMITFAVLTLPMQALASGSDLVAPLNARLSVHGVELDLKGFLTVEAQSVLQGNARVVSYVCEATGTLTSGAETLPIAGISSGQQRGEASAPSMPLECRVRAGASQLRVIVEGVVKPDGQLGAMFVRETQPML